MRKKVKTSGLRLTSRNTGPQERGGGLIILTVLAHGKFKQIIILKFITDGRTQGRVDKPQYGTTWTRGLRGGCVIIHLLEY